MDPTIVINQRVDVVCSFKAGGNIQSLCFPHKMKWQGREIAFSQLGLRHETTKGRRMIHVFDMSDGVNDYKLEFDAEGLTWTLVAMIAGDNNVSSAK